METNEKKKHSKYKKIEIRIINKSNSAITLISLVVTIILLIILAGITINMSLEKNGLFSKTKEAKEQYNETIEREKLQAVLIDAIVIKETQENFYKEFTLNEMLKKENMRSRRKYSNSRKL